MSRSDPYISRVEHRSGNSGFWWVRFCRGNAVYHTYGHEAQMTFTDLEFGGKRKALSAARAWRDKMVIKLKRGPEHFRHSVCKRRLVPRSNTGEVGVSRIAYTKTDRRTGHSYYVEYFAAIYCMTSDNGKRVPKSKGFYFGDRSRYTELEAFEAAKKFRKKMEKLHYIN